MLYDPDRKWARDAICTDPKDHRIFSAETAAINKRASPRTQKLYDQAKEICDMCPVKMQCRRDTLGELYGVWGGYDPWQRWKIRQELSKAVKRWPEERRLTWGKELDRLRSGGMVFREIQRMTGMPETPAMHLINAWKQHLAKLPPEQPKGQIIDLPLPELEKRPFPERPGTRNCWVRQSRIVSDAYYEGQTPDGLWVKVQLSERASRHAWIKAEDVHMYYPQPVMVLDYVGRPDAPDSNASVA